MHGNKEYINDSLSPINEEPEEVFIDNHGQKYYVNSKENRFPVQKNVYPKKNKQIHEKTRKQDTRRMGKRKKRGMIQMHQLQIKIW